ncbi:phage tail assembly protein [Parvibaculum sp.]|uniref:phage tail assembly protein n=1 Tax=Parvibaculum sp. TaxID=2024848 RepID=UPI002733CA66|nr:phage tail assembly protein [Parvibaculum sp.]MDP3329421.1 phage tail assembly protein [Parvibaculum sp.]
MDNTLTLTKPLERKTKDTGEVVERIDTLTFRPLVAGDLFAALDAGGEAGQGSLVRALLARSVNMGHKDVDRLDLEDLVAAMGKLEGFLPASLRTGGKPSALLQGLSGSRPDGSDGAQPS